MKKYLRYCIYGSILLILQSCLAVAVLTGTAAVATKVAGDSRTLNTQVDDSYLWKKVITAIKSDPQLKKEARIKGTAFNGNILLIGQSENMELAERAKDIALGIEGVRNVYNKISNEKPIGIINQANDSAITGLVKTKLLADTSVKSINVKIITENQEVFLLGIITKEDAQRVIDITKNTKGVNKVVDAFEYK